MARGRALILAAAAVAVLALVVAAISMTKVPAAQTGSVLTRVWTDAQSGLEAYETTAARENAALRASLARAQEQLDWLAAEDAGDSARSESAQSGLGQTATGREDPALVAAMNQAWNVLDTPHQPRAVRLEALKALNEAIDASVTQGLEQRQLEAEIAEVDPDATLGIFVWDVGDGRLVYEENADRVFTAASTYKLFVAMSMISAVDAGTWSWKTPLLGSLSLGECFNEMIVESDNACPEAWLDRVGTQTVQNQVDALGLEDTTIRPGRMATTARDLGVAVEELLVGQTLPEAGKARLTKAMRNQEFREGIPAGIPDAEVADKVGFLNELLHDAAFVSSPKGDYVFVILTANASWETIAEIASTIYATL